MARTRTSKTCVFCGAENLFWKKNAAGVVHLHNADSTQHGGPGGTCPSWGKKNNALDVAPAPAPRVYGIDDVVNKPVPPVIRPDVQPDGDASNDASDAIFRLIEARVAERIREEIAGLKPQDVHVTHDVQILHGDSPAGIIEGTHPKMGEVIHKSSLRKFHILLVGPAGSGKTYAADMVSQTLGLEYYPLSVGPQTSKSDLMGYTNGMTGEYVPSVVYTAYKFGGVLLLDELDAGHPGVLTTLNGILSKSRVRFPNGELVSCHPDFICIGAANTFGRGPTQRYAGRNRLDGATLSRFISEFWDYSEELERGYAATQPEWLSFVHKLRAAGEALKMDYIFCSRKIQQGTALLDAGYSREVVEANTVWAGVSADDKSKLLAAIR